MTPLSPSEIPARIEIPQILTQVEIQQHGLLLLDSLDLDHRTKSRSDWLFEENFRKNFDIIQRPDPICAIFSYRTERRLLKHLKETGNRLTWEEARELTFSELGDWEPNPSLSFIRFAAFRAHELVGSVSLYNMQRISRTRTTSRWSSMIGPALLAHGEATFLDIWVDTMAAILDTQLQDQEGVFHIIDEIRCPTGWDVHHWSTTFFAEPLARSPVPLNWDVDPGGFVTRVVKRAPGP